MTNSEWNAFSSFREDFKNKVNEWSRLSSELLPLQKDAARNDTPPYPIENPVVYNSALDKVTKDDEIRLIVIGDNPGKNEQREKNKAYLVGQSGKIAEGFFRRNPELKVDFRKNAVILNKTPVHTAKTNHLKFLLKNGSVEIKNLIRESQIWMAERTAALHSELKTCDLWLVGYAELKEKGIFTLYRDTLKSSYFEKGNDLKQDSQYSDAWSRVFVFQHFSMNCFLRDLGNFRAGFENGNANESLSLKESLCALGTKHKNEIFN